MTRTLHDVGRFLDRARWVERRWFEVLGGWVASTSDAEVKLLLARQSHHHAWHAELFDRVVPSANGFVPESADPPAAWRALLDDVAMLDSTVDRLTAAYGVLLPAKLEELERWRDDADAIGDAPLLRWLRFVITDETADLNEARALMAERPDLTSAAGRSMAEADLARAGPLFDSDSDPVG